MKKNLALIDCLADGGTLSHEEWRQLIGTYTEPERQYAMKLGRTLCEAKFGRKIYFRGIIEFTNICKNDCYYCGIRKSNSCVTRYRLTKDEIMDCCADGYRFGYRTFVLQGGEDGYWTDERMTDVVRSIRTAYPDCAITLSIGERSRESYQRLYDAGADRYLLRHETADAAHYAKLHPDAMLLSNRMQCLTELKEIGFQTGAGMMIGTPYQTAETLAKDMEFLIAFRPHMIGMGPFIPHKDTPFREFPAGGAELTLFLLSLLRLSLPDVLLPATTALGTVDDTGRQLGVLAGCNVVMPNLSPLSVRKKYLLYDNKVGIDSDAESSIRMLEQQMDEIGYEVVVGRGDFGAWSAE